MENVNGKFGNKELILNKMEQRIRMLTGLCPHNRPDSEAPRTKSNCIACLAEACYSVIEETE